MYEANSQANETPGLEDYLKAIYGLQGDGGVSTTDIAKKLDVSSASVTNMIKRLAEMELVDYRSYKGVRLTDVGAKIVDFASQIQTSAESLSLFSMSVTKDWSILMRLMG